MTDSVSKELFQTEIKNINQSHRDMRGDMEKLAINVRDIQVSITKVEAYSELINTKFNHIYDSIDSVSKSISNYRKEQNETREKLNKLNNELAAIQKYPTYTKWILSFILLVGGVWSYIKNQF